MVRGGGVAAAGGGGGLVRLVCVCASVRVRDPLVGWEDVPPQRRPSLCGPFIQPYQCMTADSGAITGTEGNDLSWPLKVAFLRAANMNGGTCDGVQ